MASVCFGFGRASPAGRPGRHLARGVRAVGEQHARSRPRRGPAPRAATRLVVLASPGFSPTTTKTVFFDTEPVTLPPQRLRPPRSAPSRLKSLERAGDHDGQPVERARSGVGAAPRPSGPRPRATCRRSSRCQSTANHSRDGLGDRRADALDRGQLLLATPAAIASIEPNSRASAWAAVGPTCRIDSADQHPPQRPALGLLRLSSSLTRVGATARRPCVAKNGHGRPAARRSRANRSPSSVTSAGVEQRDRPPRSRAPRCRSAPRPARWKSRSRSWAGQDRGVGAADVDVALLRRRAARCRRPGSASASRTRARVPSRRSTTGPSDLRDHVAGLAQHHGVADQHALARAPRPALCRVASSTVEPAT